MQMTDGYNVKVSIDLVVAGDTNASNTNGMCFGHEPATNGGYCMTWVGNANEADIAVGGFNVQFIPASSWSSTNWPGSSSGTILNPSNSGITYSPDTTGRATCTTANSCTGCIALGADCWPVLDTDASGTGEADENEDGMAVGATLWAKWYLPTEYEEYNDLYRFGKYEEV